jgi:D-alanyl-D-alanine carboxypeptidase
MEGVEPGLEEIMCGIPFYDGANEERYIDFKKRHEDCSWEDIITYVNIGLDRPFYSGVHKIMDPDSLTVLVNKYNQLACNYIPRDLEMITPLYNQGGLVLRRDARIAFEIMCEAAGAGDIYLEAVSAFRSFSYQRQVYFKNMTPDITLEEYQAERDKVSARAGHSEHQTGLAVDINDLEETFEATPAGIWLARNSYRYGFLLRYPKGKEKITGYSYEPWHFRYLGMELAREIYYSELTYDEFYMRYLYPSCQGE